MGQINIIFEGLCILFTEDYPSSLTVGFVGVNEQNRGQVKQDLPSVEITDEDLHSPRLFIEELVEEVGADGTLIVKGIVPIVFTQNIILKKGIEPTIVKEEGLDIAGDLSFDVFPLPVESNVRKVIDAAELTETKFLLYKINKIDKKATLPETYDVISVGTDLYTDSPRPKALQSLCVARAHFKTGELFSVYKPLKPFWIGAGDMNGDNKMGAVTTELPTKKSIKAGLQINVPDDGFALLSFDSAKQSIKFAGNKNYSVYIKNLSPTSTFNPTEPINEKRNHFLYYYSVFSPIPSILKSPVGLKEGNPNNNPYCSIIEEP